MALISPGEGDVTFISQLADIAGTPYHYGTPVKSCVGQFDPADMSNGVAETITCSMTASPSSDLTVNWARSQFDALGQAAAPAGVAATLTSENFYVTALRDETSGAAAFKYQANSLNLIRPTLASLVLDTAVTDFSETMTLSNPYPSNHWSPWYFSSLNYNVPFTAPATGSCPAPTPGNIATTVRREGPVSELSSQVVPTLGVVSGVTLSKLDPINVAGVGNGAPIQVSWTAPAVGTPTSYRVLVYKLNLNASCQTTLTLIAPGQGQILPGTSTSAIFRPQNLTAGSYVAAIRALWLPDEAPNLTRPTQFVTSTRHESNWKISSPFAY